MVGDRRRELPSDWIGTEATFGSKVAGLEDIAGLAIPYARLPARAATAYAARYRYWTDLADEPMERLFALPGAGTRTLHEMLAVAQETVRANRAAGHRRRLSARAAAAELLDRLSASDRVMLTELDFATVPGRYERVMAALGVSDAWISRNGRRVRARFRELLTEPIHRDVTFHAERLRGELGPYLPTPHLTEQLARLHLDAGEPEALMLLHLAGPYTPAGSWWENRSQGGAAAMLDIVEQAFKDSPTRTMGHLTAKLTAAGMCPAVVPKFLASSLPLRKVGDTVVLWRPQSAMVDVVDRAFSHSPTQTMSALTAWLGAAGLPAELVGEFLGEFFTLKAFGDALVRWGPSSLVQAEAVLNAHGEAMTVDAILAHLDPPVPLDKTLAGNLSTDSRFVRASRTTWALRSWGVEEYGGIAEAIGRQIDAAGGKMRLEDLVEAIGSAFPDVAESSIRSYAWTMAFVTERGVVRRRTRRDPWPTPPPLNTVRGAFRNGPNEIRLGVAVNAQVLRGSGDALPAGVAADLGIKPGQRAQFLSAEGSLTITWDLTSTRGPHRGSIRRLARAVGAVGGDMLVLSFSRTAASVTAVRIPAGTAAADVLAALAGVDRPTGESLAAGLDCAPGEVVDILTARGDVVLAEVAGSLER